MRKGPKGEKRLADVNAHAVMIAKIATGEIEDTGKNPAAVALGSEGGKARAKKIGPHRRSEIARQAARKRWEKR